MERDLDIVKEALAMPRNRLPRTPYNTEVVEIESRVVSVIRSSSGQTC